jgi:hypothetical protein
MNYEEHRQIPQAIGWGILILLTIGLVAWCMLLMMIVPETPRQWDFGQLPDVPAQSIYSTLPPPPNPDLTKTPQNITPLPEAQRSQEGYRK